MIAFIEGGMTIPMGTFIRNFLRFFRLFPTQCSPNMFRVLEIGRASCRERVLMPV